MLDRFQNVFDNLNGPPVRYRALHAEPGYNEPCRDPEHKPLRDLVIAIIERAVVDYQECVLRGSIRRGEVTTGTAHQVFCFAGAKWFAADVKEVHHFIHGGPMDRLIEAWQIEVHGDTIRRGLLHHTHPRRQGKRCKERMNSEL